MVSVLVTMHASTMHGTYHTLSTNVTNGRSTDQSHVVNNERVMHIVVSFALKDHDSVRFLRT